jgi:hypothetical protein
MMGLLFKTKKAAKEKLAADGSLGPEHILETSMFGQEYRDGEHSVCVSLDPYTVRNAFARITVKGGRIVKVA